MKRLFIIFSIVFIFSYQTKAQTSVTICAGSTVALTGATSGGTWSSSNTMVATTGSSTGIVTGVSPGTATITFTGVSTMAITSVTVNPIPTLSSPLTPPAICDSTVFVYAPTSATAGITFSWSEPYVPGITSLSASGIGNIDERLINSTYVIVPIVFIYTLSANGCTNTQNITVTVYPTPKLTSTLAPAAICDSTVFSYVPTSYTPGATYSWTRPAIAGISPGTSFGTGNISELLYNTAPSSIVVSYEYRLAIGSCPNLGIQTVDVTVEHCNTNGVNIISGMEKGIQIYPNPAHGLFTLQLPDNANQTMITISDILGKIIETRDVEGPAETKQLFSLDKLPTGTYFIKTDIDGQSHREKIVVY